MSKIYNMRQSPRLLYNDVANYTISDQVYTFIYKVGTSVKGDGVVTRGTMAWLVWRCLNGGRECSGTVELNHSLMDRAANL